MQHRSRFLTLSGGLALVGALTVALVFALVPAAPAFAAGASQLSTPHYMGIFHGKTGSGAIRAVSANDLHYQGGAVEPVPLVYISWWGSQWSTGFSTGGYTSAQAQTYIENFFSN